MRTGKYPFSSPAIPWEGFREPELHMRHKYRFLAGLLALSIVLAVAIAMRVPFSKPEPDSMRQAEGWVSSGRIAETFTPIAYPLLIAPAYRVGGIHGIIALQTALQIVLVATCFFFLLQLDVSARTAFFGSLPVALHPELLASITRSWDVALSTFLLVLLVLLLLRMEIIGPSLNVSLVCGVVFGAAVFCRPNYVLIAVALLYALSSEGKPQHGLASISSIQKKMTFRTGILTLVVFAASGISTYIFLGTVGHGSPFFPHNGSYNLFAGNNPYSASAFLANFNGELSINSAYRAQHPELSPSDPSPDFRDPSLSNFYLRSSVGYARHHPVDEVKLIGVKLFTFFRPRIRIHPLHVVEGVVKCFLALPVVFFLFLLMLPGRAPLDRVDRLLLIVYAAYILPFLLTNSDPRFRIPLDVLLLLHSIRLFAFREKSTSPSSCSDGSRIRNKEVLATFSSNVLL